MLRFASTIILLAAVASKAYAEFADQLCNVESLAIPTPDPSICKHAGMGECTLDKRSGDYYCGWEGATCSDPSGTVYADTTSYCDLGACMEGRCSGTYGDSCNFEQNTGCLGFLYCGSTSTCGGKAAKCWFDDMCESGSCNNDLVQTDEHGRTFGTCTGLATNVLIPSVRARRRQMVGAARLDNWA